MSNDKIKEFKNCLKNMGFSEKNNVFSKEISKFNCSLSVDFNNEKLIYPKQILGRERNSSFKQLENLVVFECVNRLLEKGYRPEHIELEKQWHLGHDAKSGRADICVYSQDEDKMLMIIECKTFGKEFDKALKNTKNDGGQLFSYWQQENSTKWLVLYTSQFLNGIVEYESKIINCSDDPNLELLYENDKTIRLYSGADTVYEKYNIWIDTYNGKLYDDIIFSEDTIAYHIGVKPLRKKDLKEFSPKDKVVNKFEEILRHNNISDKENAFNRLIALFICKLVDEINKQEDDEVEFQYKQGTDTYESLQDRLQKLHTEGMEKFMKEKIFYIPSNYPEMLFMNYTGQQRKNAIKDLKEKLRILKFFSNNDFAFKDVHNEELFYQNGKVLVEVVQLFEKYKIVYSSKHQFLGDLFELLLNKGFKQNEGQFFTPIPITRFIWDSLPIKNIIYSENGLRYPKVIDYACGAGHFLTEAIESINYYTKADNNNWVLDSIFGIEKDYRLARVSKISLFMNGAGLGNIIFGEGLDNYKERKIENETFDVLVANPPYSISTFKNHLKLKNNELKLLENISNDGKEIEVLFIERMSQLLKPKGIASIILPSSILSSNSRSYISAREFILKNFKIRSIVLLGSKTFGETGTNTVILFLEKYDCPPKRKHILKDSIDSIFEGIELTNWEDIIIYENYLLKIDVSKEMYNKFISENLSLEELEKINYFKLYIKTFYGISEYKKYTSTKTYKNLKVDEQVYEIKKLLYKYIKSIEADKMYYFALTYDQNTLVVTSPNETLKQKEFLGYDWSNRKGDEGIKIINPGGMLYNNEDREAENTISSNIKSFYLEKDIKSINLNTKYEKILKTCDILDFSGDIFTKNITFKQGKDFKLTSEYESVDLNQFFDIVRGVTYDKSDQIISKTETILLTADNVTLDSRLKIKKEIYLKNSKTIDPNKKLRKNDIFICFSSGSKKHIGKVAFINENMNYYSGGFMGIIRLKEFNSNSIIPKFLFYFLNLPSVNEIIKQKSSGSNINNLSKSIGFLKIPVPNIDIQQQLINECEKIDERYDTTRMDIEDYKQEIECIFHKLSIVIKSNADI